MSKFGLRKIKNKQNSGYGVRASVSYYGSAKRFDWMIEPYIRYWDIDDSEPEFIRDGPFIHRFWEPDNSTRELGVSARIRF